MTDTGTLERLDTGEFAPVRIVDGHQQGESAPYSRACGILDKWTADARRTADEFVAWVEGQTAQAAAETRQAVEEQVQQHRVFRAEMQERIKDLVNLPAGFTELPVQWAEIQPAAVPSPDRDATLAAMVRHNRPLRTGGYVPRPEDFAPAPDENMPGRDGDTPPVLLALGTEATHIRSAPDDERRDWRGEVDAFKADVRDMWRDAQQGLLKAIGKGQQ